MTNSTNWIKAVTAYADDLIEFLEENKLEVTMRNMLNGAKNWRDYSLSGLSFCYDYQIKDRLGIDKDIEVDSMKLVELQAVALQHAAQILLDADHAQRFIKLHTITE